MNNQTWIASIIVILLSSCVGRDMYKNVRTDRELNNFVTKKAATLYPRTDGIYAICYSSSCVSRDASKIVSPLAFINREAVRWANYVSYSDSTPLTFNHYNSLDHHLQDRAGKFEMKGDTILARIPVDFYSRGMKVVIYPAWFQGVLKKGDTIINWHMIEPYPHANLELNENFIDLRTPHVFFFIQSKELLGLDSLYKERIRQSNAEKRR